MRVRLAENRNRPFARARRFVYIGEQAEVNLSRPDQPSEMAAVTNGIGIFLEIPALCFQVMFRVIVVVTITVRLRLRLSGSRRPIKSPLARLGLAADALELIIKAGLE